MHFINGNADRGQIRFIPPRKVDQSSVEAPKQVRNVHTLKEVKKPNVSEKTLSRLFLRETGLSFRLWRQRLRLLSSLSLLERGDRVTDVALACGYDSMSAFIAAFRELIGATPREFFASQYG